MDRLGVTQVVDLLVEEVVPVVVLRQVVEVTHVREIQIVVNAVILLAVPRHAHRRCVGREMDVVELVPALIIIGLMELVLMALFPELILTCAKVTRLSLVLEQ